MYIVIEGQDGTGKDTQAKKLKEFFESQGKTVVAYAESGTASEDEFISEIARLNYGSKQDIGYKTRVLLFLVNRYEQWRKLAEPALKNGDIVSVKVENERATTFNNVLIRVDPSFTLEMHIDTDEANAAEIRTGMKAEIVKG